MAIHPSLVALLRESIPEFLHTAAYCVSFRKDETWDRTQVGGCLGFPASALLLSIADSIGSYHAGDPKFVIPLEGKEVSIRSDPSQHLFIFNSDYYGLSLARNTIKKIYENYRCLLVHNSALAFDHVLFKGGEDDDPFPIHNGTVHLNVAALLCVTRKAVTTFMKVIDCVVPNSVQQRRMHLKTKFT